MRCDKNILLSYFQGPAIELNLKTINVAKGSFEDKNRTASCATSFLPSVLHKLPQHFSGPEAELNTKGVAVNQKNTSFTTELTLGDKHLRKHSALNNGWLVAI